MYIAAVILAGGKSSRMGKDKALLNLGKQKMIEYVLEEIRDVFKDILIIGSPESYDFPGVPVEPDIIPGRGPLSGIHAGLIHTGKDYVFVTACDMPFVNKKLIQYMINKLDNKYDVLIPRVGEFMEPLFALYGKRCIAPIEENLNAGRYKVLDFLPKVRVNYIYPEEINAFVEPEKVFFNVNTPQELERAKDIFSNKDKY